MEIGRVLSGQISVRLSAKYGAEKEALETVESLSEPGSYDVILMDDDDAGDGWS
ncbi:MAG: hypothetical protein ACLTTJ_14220 [Blautia sp.]